MRNFISKIIGVFVLFFSLAAVAQNGISISQLQTEMLTNPEGIDVKQPRFSWVLQSKLNQIKQIAYQITVASSLEKLNTNTPDLWDSGKVVSDESVNVIYSGKKLNNRQEAFWKVRIWTNKGEAVATDIAHFSMGILTYADWKSTRWIGYDKISQEDSISQFSRLSARYLRKSFDIKKQLKTAKVYIMGLGLYELYVNGNKIGNQVLAPVPTDYTKNVKYNVFDVTSQLKEGKNALGTILGNGRFFNMRQDYKPYKIKTFGMPKMALQLVLEYTDGSNEIIRTDDSWKLTTQGPIVSNNEYDGEEYDARKELQGWSTSKFDDSAWTTAHYVQEPGGFYEAQMTPNMNVMAEVTPISIQPTTTGSYILDMGQNMVGWLQIRVKGNAGDKITLRFAESLKSDGTLYRDNLRDAKSTDTYILKGQGEEVWEPKFVYHGFRFVELSGFNSKPSLEDFKGKMVYDDIKTVGSFESSDATLNHIFKNAFWGISGNYKGMPVDCPQRNERQPWLGDRTTGAYGESFLFDNQTLYAKWLEDIKNAQTPDGAIPDVAPAYFRYYGDNVTWPGTYITVADMLYQQYADKKVIEKHYSSMKKWIVYMESNYLVNDLITKDTYGDWCVPPESLELIHSKDPARTTNGELIASAYYYHLLQIMKKFATLTEQSNSDVLYYENLAQRIKLAFNAKFFNPKNNQYGNNTVTANLLPLAFGMVSNQFEDKVFQNIVHEIEVTNKGHISTGVIGTQFLMRTLSAFGRPDLSYQLASNTTYPSWGYMTKNGATTIWELWNGNTADPKMNSQNHVMLLGDLLIWYYENIAGIKSSSKSVGFKEIIMNPDFVEGLSYVKASYESIYGVIKSSWKKTKGKLHWEVTVPANTSAQVYLPTTVLSKVKLNNQGLGNEHSFIIEKNKLVLNLSSGIYTIDVVP
jgi:alpha-L-rhamnosidase